LAEDRVFYPEGLTDSWRDRSGTALIPVDILEPAHRYTHEDPFPTLGGEEKAVDGSFREVMSRAAAHLG
jgi:hypothetical protein